MDEFALEYARQVHIAFEVYYANWLPDNPVQLGDIGVLHRKVMFQRGSNLANDFQINFSRRPKKIALPIKTDTSNNYKFTTGRGSQYNIVGKGTADMVNGGIEVILTGKNSFFFNLAGVVVQEIEDQLMLSKQIVDLYKRDLWEKDWCVITSIVYSSSTTVLGSKTGNKKIMLEAKSDLPEVTLHDAELGLTLLSDSQLDYQLISKPGAIALFKLSRLKSSIFQETRFGMAEDETDPDELKQKVLSRSLDLNDYFALSPLEEK